MFAELLASWLPVNATLAVETAARPFLKWAGGKTGLLPELLKRVPKQFGTYYEPFLGGGALFFALRPRRNAIISDSNMRLIRTYRALRDNPERVIEKLGWYVREHERLGGAFYYEMRPLDCDADPNDCNTAAWLIYLNKTCFNGLYRVNGDGAFNVPLGKSKTPPTICDAENLRACSQALQGIIIARGDFAAAMDTAMKGDFVYFDPPYMPTSETADFTSYTVGGFNGDDQLALRDLALELKERGVHVLLSNSLAARELYEGHGFQIETVLARRSINSKKDARGPVGELLIS